MNGFPIPNARLDGGQVRGSDRTVWRCGELRQALVFIRFHKRESTSSWVQMTLLDRFVARSAARCIGNRDLDCEATEVLQLRGWNAGLRCPRKASKAT